MKPSKKKALFLLLVAVGGIALFFFLRKQNAFLRLAKEKTFNVILVTLDTTRADRLGCYGFPGIQTPVIDSWARRGIRFQRCIAQTPLTLPSHTTIMTGTYPLFHGVRDNGGFIVPSELRTMAEEFQDHGYRTAAFVASYVLDGRWGLNQGFDTYFDRFDLSRFEQVSLGNVQRPANEVLDEVLDWLEKNKEEKFFLWVHLYDPHTPYEPPPPFDESYRRHPYLGEIAFADSQLGRLNAFLESQALYGRTFLILAGDHGESLGQHQEATHGFFVYQEAIHVPLIFVTPFERFRGIVVPRVTELADICPTVLEMVGIPVPPGVQGESLLPWFFNPKKESDRLAYAETYYPRFHYGWSELQSFQDQKYKLILSPDVELYDLEKDPKEQENIIASERPAFDTLYPRAQKILALYSQNALERDYQKLDEEAREKLAALGYIGSFTNPSALRGKKLASPRNKIGIFNRLTEAREQGLRGAADKAIAMIREILAEDPDILDAYFSLGNIYFRLRKFPEALAEFQKVLDRKPDDVFTAINMAHCYQGMKKPEEAESFLLKFLESGVRDSQLYFILGGLKVHEKQYDEAIRYFRQCLSLNSESASAYNALAAVYFLKEDLAQAEECARQALARNPKLSSAHYNYAQILEKKGLLSQAEDEYIQELQVTPSHFSSAFNLARLYRLAGDDEGERQVLERCLKLNPDFPLTYFYLARIYLNRGEKYREAIALVEKGIAQRPKKKDLALGYFLLADLYNRLGENSLSLYYARKGQEEAR